MKGDKNNGLGWSTNGGIDFLFTDAEKECLDKMRAQILHQRARDTNNENKRTTEEEKKGEDNE